MRRNTQQAATSERSIDGFRFLEKSASVEGNRAASWIARSRRGKTRTAKRVMHYDSPFAVPPPLLTLRRQPNNITCCTGARRNSPRDPALSPTTSSFSAKLSPRRRRRRGESQPPPSFLTPPWVCGKVPSEGWQANRLMNFIYLAGHLARERRRRRVSKCLRTLSLYGVKRDPTRLLLEFEVSFGWNFRHYFLRFRGSERWFLIFWITVVLGRNLVRFEGSTDFYAHSHFI